MTEERASVVVVGDALIDEIHDDDGERSYVGGAALNVAVGLAELGVSTTLVCTLGADAGAEQVREHLARWGVGLIASPSARGTGRAISRRVNGEPSYEFNLAAKQRRIAFSAEAIEVADAASFVVASCLRFDDDEQSRHLLEFVRDPESKLVVDPNPRAGLLHSADDFARNFDRVAARSLLVKVGDEDAKLLYGTDSSAMVARLREAECRRFLVTAGEAGASVDDFVSGVHVRADIARLDNRIVDTMGAGDATLASIVAGFVADGVPTNPDEWSALLEWAMLVAAATCRSEGATLRTP
jgi:fructokinase